MSLTERTERRARALGTCPPARTDPGSEPRASGEPTTVPPLRRELLLLGVLYGLYSFARALAPTDLDGALRRGADLLHWEQTWGLALEVPLNAAVAASPVAAVAFDYLYATLHYALTPLVLFWIYRCHGAVYRQARNVLVLATVIALACFVALPTAPPRLLGGAGGVSFVDTMSAFSRFGWWSDAASAPRGLGGLTNQFAALPSMHVGWALWSGVLVAGFAARWWLRLLGAAYPAVVSVVVMGTANHYLLDVIAGVVVVLGAGVLVLWVAKAHGRAAGTDELPPPDGPDVPDGDGRTGTHEQDQLT